MTPPKPKAIERRYEHVTVREGVCFRCGEWRVLLAGHRSICEACHASGTTRRCATCGMLRPA